MPPRRSTCRPIRRNRQRRDASSEPADNGHAVPSWDPHGRLFSPLTGPPGRTDLGSCPLRREAARRLLGLLAYRGFARPEGLWLRGRVLEDQGGAPAPGALSTFDNIRLTLKRYETDEIGGARVAWRCGKAEGEATTDEEGYFEISFEPADGAGEAAETRPPWQEVALRLVAAPHYEMREPPQTAALVRIASPGARYGVISDIDDTIVETGATNFLKHWRTVVAYSAESRTAFPGVSHFYRALAEGQAGPETNPFFYVSSSPWNLYDLFERFLALHDMPPGPMLLKDFGLDAGKWLTGGHDRHKLTMIERAMSACQGLPFLLFGDLGQRDAVIYREVARRHPGRVLAVHIRDVLAGGHGQEVEAAIAGLRSEGIDVTLEPTLRAAARHAARSGLITHAAANGVEAAIAARSCADKADGTVPAGSGPADRA